MFIQQQNTEREMAIAMDHSLLKFQEFFFIVLIVLSSFFIASSFYTLPELCRKLSSLLWILHVLM